MDLRFDSLPLCFESKIVAQYRLEDPPSCSDITVKETSKFTADIFPPPPSQYNVPATMCSQTSFTTRFEWFFFGSYQTTTFPTQQTAVAAETCRGWINRRVTQWGRLRRSELDGDMYVTGNTPQPRWKWNSFQYTKTTNAVMSKTVLTFNILHSQAQHPFDKQLVCNTDEGFCTSKTGVYIFESFKKIHYDPQKIQSSNTKFNKKILEYP